MSKVVIADSSCLIGLSKIGRLDVLKQLFGNILIPPAVYHEVVELGAGRPGAKEVKAADWIVTQAANNSFAVQIAGLELGRGESEAITLTFELQADFLILDDWKARQTALALSLPVIGTVALLKKAEEKGYIANFAETVEGLRQAGFRYLIP